MAAYISRNSASSINIITQPASITVLIGLNLPHDKERLSLNAAAIECAKNDGVIRFRNLNARNSVNLRVQLIHGPCYNGCPSSDNRDTDAQQCRTGRPAKDVYHCQARRLVSAQL